ncbi:hypothetical protein EDB19DRAFT_1594945, partial [Suillus lakei]
THGFFAMICDFMLYYNGEPHHTLVPDELLDFILSGHQAIEVTEDEIEDKSKGDMISKSVLVLR